MEMEPSRFASYRRIVARGRHITLTDMMQLQLDEISRNVAEPGFRIDVVKARGLDERVHDGGAAAAFIRAGEQIVFSSESQRPLSGAILA